MFVHHWYAEQALFWAYFRWENSFHIPSLLKKTNKKHILFFFSFPYPRWTLKKKKGKNIIQTHSLYLKSKQQGIIYAVYLEKKKKK